MIYNFFRRKILYGLKYKKISPKINHKNLLALTIKFRKISHQINKFKAKIIPIIKK